jgi:excisionase family DNA binding protein
MGQLMTLPEVASYLQIAERTVYHWAQTGRLPGFKLGTVWRFKRMDVERWIEDQKRKTERRRARRKQ